MATSEHTVSCSRESPEWTEPTPRPTSAGPAEKRHLPSSSMELPPSSERRHISSSMMRKMLLLEWQPSLERSLQATTPRSSSTLMSRSLEESTQQRGPRKLSLEPSRSTVTCSSELSWTMSTAHRMHSTPTRLTQPMQIGTRPMADMEKH